MSTFVAQDRAYQQRVVQAALAAMQRPIVITTDQHGKPCYSGAATLVVAATGAGKTVMFSMIGDAYADLVSKPPVCICMQHRTELVEQNREKFRRVNRDWDIATFDGQEKRFARTAGGFAGAMTFATAQSLSTARGLQAVPVCDVLFIDEAHHAPSPQQMAVIARLRQLNPNLRIVGFTATPERADSKALGLIFDHVADIVSIAELVEAGWLVKPVGRNGSVPGLAKLLQSVKRRGGAEGEFDMKEAASIIDRPDLTKAIIAQWREVAGDRQTAFYCATKLHASHFHEALVADGVRAALITDETPRAERRESIKAYARREYQALVSVGTLTEGWDDQQTSCVCILRPVGSRPLLIQIIGRCLRMLDRLLFPDAPEKLDGLVLDFGGSVQAFGDLATVLDLGRVKQRTRLPGPPPMKPCPECTKAIPLLARKCPLCEYVFPMREDEAPDITPDEIQLRPFDIVLKTSPFIWFPLAAFKGRVRIAYSEDAWSIVFQADGEWHAFGTLHREMEKADGAVRIDKTPKHLVTGTLDEALSYGDRFMTEHGDARDWGSGSHKMKLPPTDKQVAFARKLGIDVGFTDTLYTVSCRIQAKLARRELKNLLGAVGAARVTQVAA